MAQLNGYTNSLGVFVPIVPSPVNKYSPNGLSRVTPKASRPFAKLAYKDWVDDILSTSWNVDTATYANKLKLVSGQDAVPLGVTFSPDGTKMYIIGDTTDTVYQYALSTSWDVNTATYANKLKDISAQEGLPTGLTFSPDGTKLYVVGILNKVFQYRLATPWDVSTATYANKFADTGGQVGIATGLSFNPEGTKLYVVGLFGTVHQYALSTFWDVSTASYTNKSKDASGQDSAMRGLRLSPDGTKMYVVGTNTSTIYQYTLSPAWDVSTATYANKLKLVSGQDGTPTGLAFSPDGTKMYVVGTTTSTVYQYTLATPWDGTYTDDEGPQDLIYSDE